jgi:uncharacterized protein (DUF2235 family)
VGGIAIRRGPGYWPDEIFLFGFSRGAFTARSFGGLINRCGILRKEHFIDSKSGKRKLATPDDELVRAAWNLYCKPLKVSADERAAGTLVLILRSRSTSGHGILTTMHIKFLGVWDTAA